MTYIERQSLDASKLSGPTKGCESATPEHSYPASCPSAGADREPDVTLALGRQANRQGQPDVYHISRGAPFSK